MLEKLKSLSMGAKVGIASGAVLLAAAGVGLGITRPWNNQEETLPPDPPPVQQEVPDEPEKKPDEGLSVRAGNEVVRCTLYEGDGWSIYVPEGWSAEKQGENGARFSSGDGAEMTVEFLPGSDYQGTFVNLSSQEKEQTLLFHKGTGEGSPVVSGTGPVSRWDRYGKLFTALARTLIVGTEKPFEEVYIIPQTPDWQEAEGKTVLFLDKDGFIVDSPVMEAVEQYMKSWPEEDRKNYTGQYRINDIQWASSYTGITEDGYIDVFRADVQYRVAQDAEEDLKAQDGGVKIVNGWASGMTDVFVALSHDGGIVENVQGIQAADTSDWVGFASQLK